MKILRFKLHSSTKMPHRVKRSVPAPSRLKELIRIKLTDIWLTRGACSRRITRATLEPKTRNRRKPLSWGMSRSTSSAPERTRMSRSLPNFWKTGWMRIPRKSVKFWRNYKLLWISVCQKQNLSKCTATCKSPWSKCSSSSSLCSPTSNTQSKNKLSSKALCMIWLTKLADLLWTHLLTVAQLVKSFSMLNKKPQWHRTTPKTMLTPKSSIWRELMK